MDCVNVCLSLVASVGWIATKIGLADVVVVEIACALDVIDVVVVIEPNRCSKRALGAFLGPVASANARRLLHGSLTTLKITSRDFTIALRWVIDRTTAKPSWAAEV